MREGDTLTRDPKLFLFVKKKKKKGMELGAAVTALRKLAWRGFVSSL